MEAVKFEASRTAVLCMDYQNAIVAGYGGDSAQGMLDRAARLLDASRKAGMQVIYIHVGFRTGLPEISPRNALFSAIKNDPERMKLFSGGGQNIHPAVAPKDNDIVVTKHRVGAFTGTDLEMILRAKEIDTLVLFGIATSGVVQSTLVAAFDLDYRLCVIKDCCSDRDQELHNALLDKYYPSRGQVIDSEEFITAIS